MPPKVKTTKEDILNAALEIVRKEGADALNARSIASFLNCSTQPVFSNFETMDDLRFTVISRVNDLFSEYMEREINLGEFPAYKASGMAYIRFAKEEKELFKLLYMRDRKDENFEEETSVNDKMEAIVHGNTGLDGDTAKLFHLEMWAFVHGIATMFATGFLDLDRELVSKILTDAYMGLKKQYEVEERA